MCKAALRWQRSVLLELVVANFSWGKAKNFGSQVVSPGEEPRRFYQILKFLLPNC